MSAAALPGAQRYQPLDVTVAPPETPVSGNPLDARFEATFVGPDGRALTVPGFYDAERGYLVRVAPTLEGTWSYRSYSPEPALDGAQGSFRCAPNPNPRVHGALRLDPEHPHHLRFEDGTRCFPLGYEADWLLLIDQDDPTLERIAAFLDGVQGAGFNLLTLNLYAHSVGWVAPEVMRDPRYIVPQRAPWAGGNAQPDYGQMDPAFFAQVDRVLGTLLERGLIAHLMVQVFNKQVKWPTPGSPEDERFWRYVIARYQAFPNLLWDPAKEPFYRPAEYIWGRIALIRRLDAHRRLLTVHDANLPNWPSNPWSRRYYDPRKDWTDGLADIHSDQIHTDWYADALRSYRAAPRPYLNIEYGYERGVEALPTYGVQQDGVEVLRRTWHVTLGGGYANYYYSNTAWNLFAPTPEPPGYAWYRHYRAFWEGTRYWLLEPDERPLLGAAQEGVYCRACPGREYVVWDEAGLGFRLAALEAAAPIPARWFDPLSGEWADADAIGAEPQVLTPPWGAGHWAVLYARAD